MQTRNVIGQRIVAVDQRRVFNSNAHRMVNTVEYIELENGVRLWANISEGDGDYFIDIGQSKPHRKRKAKPETK
jgi:hypothetical protein